MSNPDTWRFTVQKRLSETTNQLNRALQGENLEVLEPVLKRLGRGQIACKHRAWLLQEDSAWARKLFKFLAYVNQSDWRARQLIKLVSSLDDQKEVLALIAKAEKDFERKNEAFAKKDQLLIPDHDLESIKRVLSTRPIALGVLFAADAWVEDYHKDFARSPNENEWRRLLKSPLNGRIGMSFALQWRYNFSRIFSRRNK